MTREEAIRRIKAWNLDSDDMEVLAVVIPELAESEDERMMREFNDWLCEEIECLTNDLRDEKDRRTLNMLCYVLTKVKDWLEKQKEQKPAESISQPTVQGKGVYKICPRCKERMVRDDSMVYTSMPPQYRYECPKCGESECDTVMYDNPEMEELKPAEWSEEDEKYLNRVINLWVNDFDEDSDTVKWLKSLRPSWKPSMEQMEALLNTLHPDDPYYPELKSLYEQLKKL